MTFVTALLVVATLSVVAFFVGDAAGEWRKFADAQEHTRHGALRESD